MTTADSEVVRSASADSRRVVPLPTWILVSNFRLSYNLLRRPDGTFNRYLAEYLDRKVPSRAIPIDGVATMDVTLDRATGLWGRIFWSPEEAEPQVASRAPQHGESQDDAKEGTERETTPSEEPGKPLGKPLLVYFHGGSFVHSSTNSAIYDAHCRRIAKMCETVVLSVNFRRAPEHRYPTAYVDGVASLRWVKSVAGKQCLHHTRCDVDKRCFLGGDSSGGNIAHNVAVRAAEEGLALAGMVLLMPMFGGERRTPSERLLDGRYFTTIRDRHWYWRAFLPLGADREHPACNPFSASAPSLVDIALPRSLVVVGGLDMLKDWQLDYVHKLEEARKSVQLVFFAEAPIGFFLLPNNVDFFSFIASVREFLSSPPSAADRQQVEKATDDLPL